MIIPAGQVELEAVLREPKGARAVGAAVFCHPHPQYGGSMQNRVIFHAAKGAVEAGVAALRFNFRGVGASTGSYDGGGGEREDVAAAVNWLEKQYPGLPMAVVGFSFGAWVGLDVGSRDPRVRALVGLGLPLLSYDFSFLGAGAKPLLLAAGTRDEFCPRAAMESFSQGLPSGATVVWIEGADHMFTHQVEQVQGLVRDFLRAEIKGRRE
jgi:hypothetical protein